MHPEFGNLSADKEKFLGQPAEVGTDLVIARLDKARTALAATAADVYIRRHWIVLASKYRSVETRRCPGLLVSTPRE